MSRITRFYLSAVLCINGEYYTTILWYTIYTIFRESGEHVLACARSHRRGSRLYVLCKSWLKAWYDESRSNSSCRTSASVSSSDACILPSVCNLTSPSVAPLSGSSRNTRLSRGSSKVHQNTDWKSDRKQCTDYTEISHDNITFTITARTTDCKY